MSHIFISYSRRDLDFAQKIVDALASNNLDTWIDWKSIPKGDDFEQKIYRGIEEADAFLFLISPDSLRSDMCQKEIAFAALNGKRILPIVLRDAEQENIPPAISKPNWIFCRAQQDDFDTAIKQTWVAIHADFEWLQYHTILQVKALNWDRYKDNSRLLRGRELMEAGQQLANAGSQKDPQPTQLQRQFVFASQRNEVRQRRQTTIGMGFGLIIVAVLAVFAWVQRNTAVAEANSRATAESNAITEANAKATALVNEEYARATAQAEKVRAEEQSDIALARQLAVNANDALGTDDGSLSLLLAMESVSATYSLDRGVTPEAENSLRRAIAASPWRKTLVGNMSAIVSMARGNDLIAIADDNTSVRLWNINTGERVTILNDHLKSPDALAFSREFLAVASDDGTIRLWNVDTMREIAVFHGHTKIVNALDFNPSGNLLATVSSDMTVRLWDVETARQLAILIGHSDSVNGLAFSPNGKFLATASNDGTIRLWDTETNRGVVVLKNQSRASYFFPMEPGGQELFFSPDGKFLAAKGSGLGVRIWSTESWQETEIGGHKWPTHKVPCLVKGDAVFYEKTLLTTGCDGIIRSWDIVSGEQKEVIGNRYISAYGKLGYGNYWEKKIAVPPDTLLTSTIPDGVMIWKKEFSEEGETRWQDHMLLKGHRGQVTSMIIDFFDSQLIDNVDESIMVTAGEDGTIRFWNVSKYAGRIEADQPESIEELMTLAQQRVQRDPPELTCEERVEYLHEELDCLVSTPTP